MDTRIQLRDRVVDQLLGILRPFQVVALDVGDVGSDDGKLFLRVHCQENDADEYKFVSLSAQAQADLETFLVDGLPLYEKCSDALFPNRFGGRLTTRSLRMRHQREYGIKREVVEIGGPVGVEFIRQFNLWNRAEVVYFARAEGGLVKVGHSKCFSTRLQTLESEEGQMRLLGLVEGSLVDEACVKSRFGHLLVRGSEWFEPAEELLDFIGAVNRKGRGALDKSFASEDGPTEEVDELTALRRELEEQEAKADEYLGGWRRVRVEFANYKNRVERERAEVLCNVCGGADIKIRCDSCGKLRRGVSIIPLYGEVRVCGECRGVLS